MWKDSMDFLILHGMLANEKISLRCIATYVRVVLVPKKVERHPNRLLMAHFHESYGHREFGAFV